MEWVAEYEDGSRLRQYDGGRVSKYTDIDRDRLSAFVIVSDGDEVLRMNLGEGQRLICRKRVRKSFTGELLGLVWLVGWQRTVRDESGEELNVQHIHVISEDGRIETIPRWNEEVYPVRLLEEEKNG